MSFQYGSKSMERLDTCHTDLRSVALGVIKRTPVDLTIVHGWRGEELQGELVRNGVSKAPWPTSKHNHESDGLPCSLALDFAPFVNNMIPWDDTHLFALIAGVFFAEASDLNVKLRWGGDWDMDGLTTDQTFMDWGHLELVL